MDPIRDKRHDQRLAQKTWNPQDRARCNQLMLELGMVYTGDDKAETFVNTLEMQYIPNIDDDLDLDLVVMIEAEVRRQLGAKCEKPSLRLASIKELEG